MLKKLNSLKLHTVLRLKGYHFKSFSTFSTWYSKTINRYKKGGTLKELLSHDYLLPHEVEANEKIIVKESYEEKEKAFKYSEMLRQSLEAYPNDLIIEELFFLVSRIYENHKVLETLSPEVQARLQGRIVTLEELVELFPEYREHILEEAIKNEKNPQILEDFEAFKQAR
jgi:hypothetical protein